MTGLVVLGGRPSEEGYDPIQRMLPGRMQVLLPNLLENLFSTSVITWIATDFMSFDKKGQSTMYFYGCQCQLDSNRS